jgi:AhpD family alkylhydroperoxidase
VADEEQRLTDDQRELVAVGASVGAGCQPCVSHHLKAGAKAGVSPERLLAAVTTAELAAAEAAERMTDHVRAQLGGDVREPKTTLLLDEALASLGGALGSNDLANVRRQLKACRELGVTGPQLREAIELGRAVQENATRMHTRAALDLLDRATGTGRPAGDAGPREEKAGSGATASEPNFVSMMAKFLALIDSYDGADLGEKMAQCFNLFEPSCCGPYQTTDQKEQSGAGSTSADRGACDCTTMFPDCGTSRKDGRQ